jgi:two-component system cell cycle response regulator
MKILVADDDPISRRMMQAVLQRHGYEVVVAADGLAALELLSQPDAPRLALLDWMMPGLDGPTVCRRARRLQGGSYIYIMLLTSKQSGEDIVTGLQAGADDYVTKPCNPAELKARLLTGQRILQLEDKLVEAREAMRARATRDGLTDLWNRTSILGYLKDSIDHSRERESAVSVLLCDVDHFKSINDRFGHQVGDEVLQEIASRLQLAVRHKDFVGRYGGEEFLIVLNQCRPEDLPESAERVRRMICEVPVQTSAGMINVSISLGANAVPQGSSYPTINMIVKEADLALYEAKAKGRNRVCLVQPTSVAA